MADARQVHDLRAETAGGNETSAPAFVSYTFAEAEKRSHMGLFALLGLVIGVGAGGAAYSIAKKKKIGTGGSAAAAAAVGAAAWYLWPVVVAGGVVYYVVNRNKKQKALNPAD